MKYDRDVNTTVCDCCGGEFYDDATLKAVPVVNGEVVTKIEAYGDYGKLPAKLNLCEECTEEMPEPIKTQLGVGDAVELCVWPTLVEHCNRERVLNFIPANEQINSEEDVRDFFAALTKYLVWHPENDFAEYVRRHGDAKEQPTNTPCPSCGREEEGQWFTPCPSDDCPSHDARRIFDDAEAKELNTCMERAFEVCEKITKHEVDPYEIGFQELAKHDWAMAAAMGRNHKTGLLIEADQQPSEEKAIVAKVTLDAAIADNRLTEACEIIRALLKYAQPQSLNSDELMVFTSTIGRASALLAIIEQEAQ